MKPLAHTLTHAFAALGLVGAAISPALASDSETPSVQVRVADLDLTSAAGQRALDRRVENAARSICAANITSTGSRIATKEGKACLAKARASVRDQVAKLTADPQRGG